MSGTASGGTASNAPLQDQVLTLSFNQDCTAVALGTARSYCLFTITQNTTADENQVCGIKPLMATKYIPFEEVRIIERVLSRSFITVVSDQTPRKLNVLDVKRGIELHAYKYATNVLAVRISRSRLVVYSADSIWIHDTRDLRVLQIIREVPTNNNGLCALSPNNDNPYLAYSGSSVTGEIKIFDTIKLKDGIAIHAHDGPLAAMSFDMSGTRIATASDRGTVIRVHNAVDGTRLFEFRRGTQRVAKIYSLAFSPDSMFLAASSNTGTIHIFRLAHPEARVSEEPDTWIGSFGRLMRGVASYLPQQTSEVFTQDRSFATVHFPPGGPRTTIAMNFLNGKLILFVGGYDGVVSVYEVNINDGGECKKLNQYDLLDLSISAKNEQLTSSDLRRSTLDEPSGEYPPNVIRNDSRSVSMSSASTNENATYYSIQKNTTED